MFGLLGYCVLGLFGSWVAGLLGCWVVVFWGCWVVGFLICCVGPAECAERLNPPPLGRRLKSHSHLSVPGRVSLPYPPAGRAHSVGRPSPSAIRAPFSTLVFLSEFWSHMWTASQTTFSRNLSIFGGPDVDFRSFWVSKQVLAAHFFGVFSKTVILLKSCSRCGGSTVFKV